jgi:predicted small lipoprotein YifL
MENKDTSVAAAHGARPRRGIGLTLAMVAAAGLSTGALALSGCGQKGPLYMEAAPGSVSPRPPSSSLRPGSSTIDSSDPQNAPRNEPITPPVVYPPLPQR